MTSKKMGEMTKQETKEIISSALDFIAKDFKASEESTENLLKYAKGAMMFLASDLSISAAGFIANTASEIIEELESRYENQLPIPYFSDYTTIQLHEVKEYLSMRDEVLLYKARRGLRLHCLDDVNKGRIIEAVLGAYDRSAGQCDMFRINNITVHSKLAGHNKEHAYIDSNDMFILDVNDFPTVIIGMYRVETLSIT